MVGPCIGGCVNAVESGGKDTTIVIGMQKSINSRRWKNEIVAVDPKMGEILEATHR